MHPLKNELITPPPPPPPSFHLPAENGLLPVIFRDYGAIICSRDVNKGRSVGDAWRMQPPPPPFLFTGGKRTVTCYFNGTMAQSTVAEMSGKADQ